MKNVQMVIFRLSDSYFGVDIMKVREIMALVPITPLPTSAPYLLGVINVRGKVVPVVDLRMKLGLPCQEATDDSRLLLVEKDGKVAGLLVDEVSEVLTLSSDDIETTAQMEVGSYSESVEGIAKLDDRLLIFLNVEKLI